jgi:CRP-like cAMP-binding protein
MDPYDLLIDHFKKDVKLSSQEEKLITDCFSLKEFKKNDVILSAGDVSSHMRFVIEGCLKSYYLNEDGKEHIVHFGIEGWWINDLYSYFTGTPSKQYIQAIEKGKFLQAPKNKLDELFDSSHSIERFFRLKFQNAYVAFIDRTVNSLSKTAEVRYAEFCVKYPEIEQRVPQYALASYLGITPEFLSVLRKRRLKKRS